MICHIFVRASQLNLVFRENRMFEICMTNMTFQLIRDISRRHYCFLENSSERLDLYSDVSSLTTIRTPDKDKIGGEWLPKVSILCHSITSKAADIDIICLQVTYMRTPQNSHVYFVSHSVCAYCQLATLRPQHAIISAFSC